jgi:hypothetical protein
MWARIVPAHMHAMRANPSRKPNIVIDDERHAMFITNPHQCRRLPLPLRIMARVVTVLHHACTT